MVLAITSLFLNILHHLFAIRRDLKKLLRNDDIDLSFYTPTLIVPDSEEAKEAIQQEVMNDDDDIEAKNRGRKSKKRKKKPKQNL